MSSIRIYFDDALLHIFDINSKYQQLLSDNSFLNPDKDTLIQLVDQLKNGKVSNIAVLTNQYVQTIAEIRSHFTVIEAAGGIVENKNNEILFIFRRGKWDLPKGKIETDESPAIAAKREIEEETGVKELSYIEQMSNTYHYYQAWGQEILKISHWFHFIDPNDSLVIPQVEEDIEEVRWFGIDKIHIPLSNTYENIKNIMQAFLEKRATENNS